MARTIAKKFLHQWHKLLGLPRQSPLSWHRDRLREELQERRNASTPLEKLSEAADVFFSISRAKYDGYPVRPLPRFSVSHILVYAYMLAKFTSRWAFYRVAAFLCGAPNHDIVREVVNPTKDYKLDEVAFRHHIDQGKFKRIGRRLRRVWPLFP
ncbi:hypothetical protein F5Y00DRAFT_264486 [Daldinia vernicosa]|uniref:uncharacterized protein n=1 Tax=Daldinia vernicosa TaxID=114800 RepID=UPI002007706A|nr:uncharacterized protein F5Y00DRAFT_264486 [Daldinia vernicosa]KAI0846486.1 hypothetical protein F5Y00DRAFT_264486 [Daldinia vernicosa]